MGEVVTTGKPRANALSGSSVRSTGFFAKLKLPGVPRYVLPGWENEAFDTVTVTPGELVYTPILVSETTTYTRIWVRTVGPPVAGLCRMGVYRFRDGAPGALVLDAGTVATDPPGVKEIVISLQLQPGYYFLARVCDAEDAPHLGQGRGAALLLLVGLDGDHLLLPQRHAGLLRVLGGIGRRGRVRQPASHLRRLACHRQQRPVVLQVLGLGEGSEGVSVGVQPLDAPHVGRRDADNAPHCTVESPPGTVEDRAANEEEESRLLAEERDQELSDAVARLRGLDLGAIPSPYNQIIGDLLKLAGLK